MLEKITSEYAKFPDSFIEKVNFTPISKTSESIIEIILSCFNIKKGNKKEIIKLILKKIEILKFNQFNDNPSLFLDEIYINNENDLITIDFFPIDHFDYLEENPNSAFIIKCKEISYEVLLSE
ncbi:hypothetical protein N4T20_14240 [Flavobacterium sp. TR2]|uniref:hypothetical protein n=1 Tax=Flavobacterium sp. TR2 TaxID=2977321 RepID=UPI0021B12C4A|nr:hypothetical protein [Flavobacterium sp. TR2]UWY26879.1 hypothetical protein N4T20_14240 [Flavobacterium sp. TR2]